MPNRPAARHEVAGPKRARRAVVLTATEMIEMNDPLAIMARDRITLDHMARRIMAIRNTAVPIMARRLTVLRIIIRAADTPIIMAPHRDVDLNAGTKAPRVVTILMDGPRIDIAKWIAAHEIIVALINMPHTIILAVVTLAAAPVPALVLLRVPPSNEVEDHRLLH